MLQYVEKDSTIWYAGRMRDDNDLFDALEEKTTALDNGVLRALRLSSMDYAVNTRFGELALFLSNLSLSGKIAAAQWALAQIRKDDARGLPVYYCLKKILKRGDINVDAHEFMLLARNSHPYIDGKSSVRDSNETKRQRLRMSQNRRRENIEMAKDLRGRFVDLIANPMPTDLFTRVTLFENLSEKEMLACFIACIGHQNTDWVAQAFSEAQNARAQLASEGADTRTYARSLKLAEIYLKALQLHMQNIARSATQEAPQAPPPLTESEKPLPEPKLDVSEQKGRSKSSNKLPFSG